jgi:hypothetical protein
MDTEMDILIDRQRDGKADGWAAIVTELYTYRWKQRGIWDDRLKNRQKYEHRDKN